MSKKTSIEQLARSLGVNKDEVSKAIRQELRSVPEAYSRDPQFMLTTYQCQVIRKALGYDDENTRLDNCDNPNDNSPDLPSDLSLPMQPDPPSDPDMLDFHELNYSLWFHPDVTDSLQGMTPLKKRLGIVLQHLGAHGKTSIVKGCNDNINRGWLRSPLGGNNGMQFYLWWATQGNPQVKSLDTSKRSIFIRAVRHHDNHEPLKAGSLDEYLLFTQQELDDDSLVGKPWTEAQMQFIDNSDPVRLLLGRPGSGKTTALWKAIEARSNQNVLYLTWSRELTRLADEHFQAFAPAGVVIKTLDFATFLGEVCGFDVERKTLSHSQALFSESIKRLSPNILGPWAGREKALFAEIRAFLVGRAIPGDIECETDANITRLKDKVYLENRGSTNGIGKDAAESVLRVFRAIKDGFPFSTTFPELDASFKAVGRLKSGIVPEGFLKFDRVVVDEVQDFTLLEMSVIIELVRGIAQKRKFAPWLLAAGDDGQTVRPSGFDWGPYKDLIADGVRVPKEFLLEDNLRCPQRIAGVIERASSRYAKLDKSLRPRKQRQLPEGQHVDARLFHVNIENPSEAIELFEQLGELEKIVIISPQENLPSWLPKSMHEIVMTPAEAKGLEYQSVCVLNPGSLLSHLNMVDGNPEAELEEHQSRTIIDQLRVSLSRATETLAFVDVEATDAERNLSWELLAEAAPLTPQDFIEILTDENVTLEEQILARISDARNLIDERPQRAWQRAYQAMRLLGKSDLPNGVVDKTVRRDAFLTLLATAARLLVDGVPDGVNRNEVDKAGMEAANELKSTQTPIAFSKLVEWTEKRSSPINLLKAASVLNENDGWLKDALKPVSQALRKNLEDCSKTQAAAEFTENVEEWLKVTGFTGKLPSEANRLRCIAVDTLIGKGSLKSAEHVFERVNPENPFTTGKLREAQGRYMDAADAFQRAGSEVDALRNIRNSGEWGKAVLLAHSEEKKDLEWLVDMEQLLKRRPEGHFGRLTTAESTRLDNLTRNLKEKPQSFKEKATKKKNKGNIITIDDF